MMKRALAPLALGGHRFTIKTFPDPTSATEYVEKTHVEFWVASSELRAREVTVEVVGYELLTGRRIVSDRMLYERWTHVVDPNKATELKRFTIPNRWNDASSAVVVFGRLCDSGTEKTLSRVSLWPEPYMAAALRPELSLTLRLCSFKYLAYPSREDTGVSVSLNILGESSGEIRISARRPVKGLVLSLEPKAQLDDNFLDLAPGDEQVVKVNGLSEGTTVSWRRESGMHLPQGLY